MNNYNPYAWQLVLKCVNNNRPVNTEILIKGNSETGFKVADINFHFYFYKNLKYIREMKRQEILLKHLINKGCKVDYYNDNFIIVNGITFNGWNKEQLERLTKEVKQKEKYWNYDDIEFEVSND